MNMSRSVQPQNHRHPDRWSLAPHLPVQRNARCLLVAVATADGARVDRAFEAAETFLLFEQDGERTCFIGRQPCPCATAEDAGRRTRLLADCDMVLCAGISETCRQALAGLGIDCSLGFAGLAVGEAVTALGKGGGH